MVIEEQQMNRRRVRINYVGKYADGTVFDDHRNGEPIEITIGGRSVPAALDRAIARMKVGEDRTVEVPKAYGDHHPEAVQRRIPRQKIPNGEKLAQGMTVLWTSPANPLTPVPVTITRADEFTVDLDFNHPLAGKDLVYWVKLVEILD